MRQRREVRPGRPRLFGELRGLGLALGSTQALLDGEVVGVGFGIPCLIDQRTGTAVMAVNLPLNHLPFRDLMAERLGLPVTIDNDANCAALAEARAGAGRGASELVMLTLGTGIGGGLVLGGELYRGSVGAAAELGHMVVDLDGPPCQGSCPNRGCLESVASGTALVRAASLAVASRPDTALGRALEDGRPLTGPLVTELAHDGDAAAVEALALIGGWLGVGIANLVNMLNPEVVVIGGGVVAAGELLLEPARRWPSGRFIVAGPQYPETIAWPANVERQSHL
ncbi:MAG: ROK family protein, partial [Proteobacteria bacterium]|nr:ROK family protein [Pseudomonadota bacterium]